MKPCPEYREAIATQAAQDAHANGAAAVPATAMLRRHLDACPACRRYQARLSTLCAHLGRAAAEAETPSQTATLSPGFHQRLQERVRADATGASHFGRASAWARWREWIGGSRLAWAAIGAAASVAILSVFWWGGDPAGRGDRRAGHEGGSNPSTGAWAAVHPPAGRVPANGTPRPTLMAMSRALRQSPEALDAWLAQQELELAANDPPSTMMGRGGMAAWESGPALRPH